MKPLIFISNDDGYQAAGINFLIDTLRPIADLIVVAPDCGRSGASTSITPALPLRYHLVRQEEGLTVYSCTGSPTDCVKLGLECLLPADRKPDLVIGGINHGDNSSVNAHYSGTMGVVHEGAMQGYPAVAFSLCDMRPDADFTPLAPYLIDITLKAIAMGMPAFTCLNVNFPLCKRFEGVRICRMAKARWVEEVAKREHPYGAPYCWLVGYRECCEPEAEDTDDWALSHGYVAVTPTTLDNTAYALMEVLQGTF